MSRFHVTPLISHLLSAPGVDLSALSVDSVLRCLKILVPYYIEDLVNEGYYGELARLTEYLLDESLAPLSHSLADSTLPGYRESSDAVEGLASSSQAIEDESTPFQFPPISSSELEVQVFTPRPSSGNLSTEDGHRNNRRLEWLGDAAIQLSTTLMLEDLYPQLRTGLVASVRGRVVSNSNLGTISRAYRLYKRFKQVSGRDVPDPDAKVHADLLESYVGALCKEMEFYELHSFLVGLLKPSVVAAYLAQKGAPREPRLKGKGGHRTCAQPDVRISKFVDPFTEPIHEYFLSESRSLGLSPRFELEEAHSPHGPPRYVARVYLGEQLISTGMGLTISIARAEASRAGLLQVITLANVHNVSTRELDSNRSSGALVGTSFVTGHGAPPRMRGRTSGGSFLGEIPIFPGGAR